MSKRSVDRPRLLILLFFAALLLICSFWTSIIQASLEGGVVVDYDDGVSYLFVPTALNNIGASTLLPSQAVGNAWKDDDAWKPLDCRSFLQEVRNGGGNSSSTAGDIDPDIVSKSHVRLTNTSIPFYISLHQETFDSPRFGIWSLGYYYEKALTNIFYDILRDAPPNARVLDMGGNIGWFTLVAAAAGHHIDVFEPNPINTVRLCESMRLNEWTDNAVESEINTRRIKRASINLRALGVADKPNSTMHLRYTAPGAGSFVDDPRYFSKAGIWHPNMKVVESIPMVTLDQMATDLNWFREVKSNETTPKIAILKIDIEGFEPPVVAGAKRFLSAGLAENILMEATGRADNSDTINMIQSIIDAGYELHKFGHFKGPTNDPRDAKLHTVPKDKLASTLVKRFLPQEKKQINFWWKYGGTNGRTA